MESFADPNTAACGTPAAADRPSVRRLALARDRASGAPGPPASTDDAMDGPAGRACATPTFWSALRGVLEWSAGR
jgi:hypothetical protein